MSSPGANERLTCPDDGTCWHECEPNQCFRVAGCGPLSGVYPNDDWPDEVRVQHGLKPRKRTAEETLTQLQIWLNQRRDKGFRHAAEIRSVNNDYGAQRAAYGWTREAMMAQETLDWIAEGNGNG